MKSNSPIVITALVRIDCPKSPKPNVSFMIGVNAAAKATKKKMRRERTYEEKGILRYNGGNVFMGKNNLKIQQERQQQQQLQQRQQQKQQQQHRVIHHLIHYAFRFRCILFQAPESGAYTFYIAGDDQCEFWISTDETATNAKYQMGFAIGQWTNPNQWNK